MKLSDKNAIDELVGTLLDDKYRLEEKLGEGGMGIVYRATHIQMSNTVAVKILHPRLASDSTVVELFRREARAAAQIRHPNALVVTDFGVTRDAGIPYVVMEFLEGEDLRHKLKRHRQLDFEEAFRILSQTCAAVSAAHARGVIHGDLKPDNIWLIKTEPEMQRVKVLNFGIAKLKAGTDSENLAQKGMIVGTPSYMSPEQCRGEEVDAGSDVYILGVILYEMLTGQVPFDGSAPLTVVLKHITETPRRLRELRPDIPEEVERVVMRSLEKRPADRQKSAVQLAQEFEAALHGATRTVVLSARDRTAGSPVPSAALPPIESHTADSETKPLYLDENVQFTVYRPQTVQPLVWSTLLAFAHLSERRPDANENEPDPIEEVKRQAQRLLGERIEDYQKIVQDSSQAVPREGEITFMPSVPGIEFNPPSRTFKWQESVHREDFRLRAPQSLDGQTARGRLCVFLGSILLAEVTLTIRVDSAQTLEPASFDPASARCYRKIFASYSHLDSVIVDQFEHFVQAFGDEYLRDVSHLRAGEVWSDRLEKMIIEADIFQLFWSTNSMGSEFVRREWEFALSRRQPNFIRPTYWEEPLPSAPEKNLPPEALSRLHFQRLIVAGVAPPAHPSTAPSFASPPMWAESVAAHTGSLAKEAAVEPKYQRPASPSRIRAGPRFLSARRLVPLAVIVLVSGLSIAVLFSYQSGSREPLRPANSNSVIPRPTDLDYRPVTITTLEPTARVYRGDTLIGTTPFVLQVQNGARIKLTLKAEGYSDKDLDFTVAAGKEVYTFAMGRTK
ncbi:MAG: protein kinase [Acidobacteriota bacterium]